MEAYSDYKPCSIPWLDAVPEHWEVRRIKTCLRERDERSQDGDGELLSLTRAQGLVPQAQASTRIALTDDLSNHKVCDSGDLVMNRMQAWSGMFAIASRRGLVSPDYCVLQPVGTSCDTKYLEYLFKVPDLVGSFAQHSKGIGSGFNRLYTPELGRITIAVPPFLEQQAIVRYLDHVGRRIRRYVSAKRRLIELLEEERQAVVAQAVTRSLDPNVRLKPSGVEWLGDLPEHWDVRRLRAAAENVVDLTRTLASDEIYLALENVKSWTGRYAASNEHGFERQVKRFKADDVLFGKLRPYLAKVVCPSENGVCVGEFLVLRPRDVSVSPRYLENVLRSKPVIDAIDASTFGAKMPRADWLFIGGMRIPVPPLTEQAAIVARVAEATADIDTAIARTRQQIELMEEYRTALVADVVTGKLDVREAAKLLPDREVGDDWPEDGPPTDFLDDDDGIPDEPTEDSVIESEVTA